MFDKDAALKAGYSIKEINDFLGQQSGFDVAAARQHYSDEEIFDFVSSGGKQQTQQPSTLNKVAGGVDKFVQGAGQFAEGFAKSGINLVKNVAGLTERGLEATVGKGIEAVTGKPLAKSTLSPGQPGYQALERVSTPEGGLQKAGFVAGEVAQSLLPAGAIGKAEAGVNALIKGAGLLKGIARMLGKAAISGGVAGATTLGQTGDIEKAKNSALTGGAVRGVLNVAGGTLRALKVPERLYKVIFKDTVDDAYNQLRSGGLQNLAKTSPNEFKQLVDAGIIKTVDGQPKIVDSLAKQAIDKGLKGSLDNMANGLVKSELKTELAVQNLAKNYTKPLVIEPQYKKVLQEIADTTQDVGFGELSKKARGLANAISDDGSVNALSALEMRRFLDGMRRSFTAPTEKMSLQQQNLKFLTDNLRGKLANIPGFSQKMKDYKFYIEALDAVSTEAKRRNNANLVGLIDAAFLGPSLAAGTNAGVLVGLARKLVNLPSLATRAGSSLSKNAIGKTAAGTIQTGSTQVNK